MENRKTLPFGMKTGLIFLMVLALPLMNGCGRAKKSEKTLSGVVSAGLVKNAAVTIYTLSAVGARLNALASGVTDNDGLFSISSTLSSQPVEIVATGGSYFEEAGGTSVNLGTTEIRLRLASFKSGQSVGITPLTEIATARSQALIAVGASLSDGISTANSAIAQASGISDITLPPVLPTKAVANGLTLNSPQVKYALVLAGLSQYAKDNALSSSLAAMASFSSDFTSDGKFDGNAWTTDLANAISAHMASSEGISAGFGGMTAPTLSSTPTACTSGLTFCSTLCVNLTSSASNCGACGTVCSYNHATAACNNGTCGIGSCNSGYGNCDQNTATGCGKNLNTDITHCGMCGQACNPGESCVDGLCT